MNENSYYEEQGVARSNFSNEKIIDLNGKLRNPGFTCYLPVLCCQFSFHLDER